MITYVDSHPPQPQALGAPDKSGRERVAERAIAAAERKDTGETGSSQ